VSAAEAQPAGRPQSAAAPSPFPPIADGVLRQHYDTDALDAEERRLDAAGSALRVPAWW
jgi:hypothetical protein